MLRNHKINPLTGTVSSLISEGIIDTTQSATLADDKYDTAVEAAAGVIINAGYAPTGVTFAPTLSFGLATMKDTTGRRIYPELGYDTAITNFEGMNAASGAFSAVFLQTAAQQNQGWMLRKYFFEMKHIGILPENAQAYS